MSPSRLTLILFYQGEGDQKFVPDLSAEALRRIAAVSTKTKNALEKIMSPLLAVPPFNFGYPSKNAQSAYYPGSEPISLQEVAKVSESMQQHSIEPENTRLRKTLEDGKTVYQLLQASAETGDNRQLTDSVFLVKGDHSEELTKICSALERAKEYAANDKQARFLEYYVESFRTGNLKAFQESQKEWVMDFSARVENLIGFIEPYRDPAGIRAEWEGMVGIADPSEASRLRRLVGSSTAIIRQLPWAVEGLNDGKGPFEKHVFVAPDFTSVHGKFLIPRSQLSLTVLALAVCSSIVFEAANLPNVSIQSPLKDYILMFYQYDYIRETCGFKNVVLANRLRANNNPKLPCHWVDPSELQSFKSTTHIVRYITTAIHELLGHGTGKLLSESTPGNYNFDPQDPPINPISGKAITSNYLPGQTWTSVFGKLAGTVEECRAILISEYLMDSPELLEIFGYTDTTDITAEDRKSRRCLYITY